MLAGHARACVYITDGEKMIRPAITEDASRLAEIHIFGWRMAYKGIISDEILFKLLQVNKRIKTFKKTIGEKKEETYVFEDKGIVKAFMTIGKSRNEDKSDAFELWGIYVEPAFKRSGIGKELLEYCEEIGKERNYTENILWVLEKNKPARLFYEKMGYKADGKEKLIEKYNVKEIRYIKKI
jgi:ribosomal protein S18 acetylase RimI-like enzyme